LKELSATEGKILAAAELEFQEKGYFGARMREIADRAGINKGLLHYYFKTKDSLFAAIFDTAFAQLVGKINSVLDMDIPLMEKIDTIVDTYFNLLTKNSAIPLFVINELNKDADRFVDRHIRKNTRPMFHKFKENVDTEVKTGRIRPIDARHLLMNIISMIVFPFIARPVMQVVFSTNHADFKNLLNERKNLIKEFTKQALKA
jgi:AcrR family transcriptional regulator